MVPLVVSRVSPLGRPFALVPPDVASAIYNIYGCNCITVIGVPLALGVIVILF